MKILKSKLFKILIIMFLIGILFGIVSYFLMDSNEINIIKNDLINYITNIKNDNLNYTKGLFNSIVLNLKYNSLIWIAGIIFVLIFLVPQVWHLCHKNSLSSIVITCFFIRFILASNYV